jgi:hypothetical protein
VTTIQFDKEEVEEKKGKVGGAGTAVVELECYI